MRKSNSLVCLLAFIMLVAQAVAYAGATMSISPASIKAQAGNEFTVDVNVATDADISSIFNVLIWDSSKIDFVEYIQVGDFTEAKGIDVGANIEEEPGKAYVGVAKMFATSIAAPFDGTVAQIKFQVKDGIEKGTEISLILSKNPADTETYSEIIGTFDADGGEVATEVSGASVEVVKLFNAKAVAKSDNAWGTDAITSDAFNYTDENGAAYAAGGKVIAIGDVTVTVGGAAAEYSAADFGAFSVTADGKVKWDGKALRSVIKHDTVVYSVNFVAESGDGKYTDTGIYGLTVKPVNQAPVVKNFAIVNDETYGMKETAKVKFTFDVEDPEDDTITVNNAKMNGAALNGNFTASGNAWTFTGIDALSQDLVAHTVADRNADNVFVAPWAITFSVTDGTAQVAGEAASDAADKSTWLTDVDRKPVAPTFGSYSWDNKADYPTAPTTESNITASATAPVDPDGDAVTLDFTWSNGKTTYAGITLPASKTAKGDTWTATAVAKTNPYGTDVLVSAVGSDITIGNAKPVLAGKDSIFIRMEDGQTTATGTAEFTVTDADAEDYEVVLGAASKGTVNAVKNGSKFTVTFTVTTVGTEFENDPFTVKVNDGTDDSNELTVNVTYKDNPPAEITVVTGAPEDAIDEVDAEGNASAFALKISTTDSTEVAPYGIKSIKWTVFNGKGLAIAGTAEKTNAADGAGNYPTADEMEITVNTKGYETLNGDDRAAEEVFTVIVEVEDALGAKTQNEFNVTVADVDRAPKAPTAINFLYVDENKTGAKISADAAGAQDEDGDAVSYIYEFYVDGALKETTEAIGAGSSVEFATELVKGQVPSIKAKATSKRANGGADLFSDQIETVLDKVANTAPVLDKPEEGIAELEMEEYVDGYNEATSEYAFSEADNEFFAFHDIDEEAGADTVTVTVDAAGLEGYATAEVVDGKVVITREANKNTVGLEGDARPYFVLRAEDEDGAFVEAKYFVTIAPVNEAPAVAAKDVYVTASLCDGEEHVAEYYVTFGLSADEADQLIDSIVDLTVEDAEGLFADINVEPSEDGTQVVIKYTMAADAAAKIGKEATVTFAVKDNGGMPFADTSDAITVKFVVGATPWYPQIALPVEDEGFYEVTIMGEKGSKTTLVVSYNTVYPADYYNQGNKGLAADNYTYEVRAWTPADGADDEVIGGGEFTVEDYDLPGKASVSYDNGFVNVIAPLAAKYVVEIKKDGVAYKTIAKDFTPDDEDQMTSEDEFELALYEAGTYVFTAYGINPKGEGELSDEVEVVIEDDEESELAWPEEGEFSPDGEAIFVSATAKGANVNFNWPVVSNADSYVLCIENIAAGYSKTIELKENSKSVALTFKGDKASYSWWVIAVDAKGNELSSDTFAFTVARKTNEAFIEAVYADGSNTLSFEIGDEGAVFTAADVQVAHIGAKGVYWYAAQNAKATYDDEYIVTVSIPGATLAAGDIVYVRTYVNGVAGEWKIYTAKEDY